MEQAWYEALPNYLEAADVEGYCFPVLDTSAVHDINDALAKLAELGERQWHRYEEPSPALKQRLEAWFEENWNPTSPQFLASCLCTSYCFALSKKLYEKALALYGGDDHDEFAQDLAHSPGPCIDPYWSLKV